MEMNRYLNRWVRIKGRFESLERPINFLASRCGGAREGAGRFRHVSREFAVALQGGSVVLGVGSRLHEVGAIDKCVVDGPPPPVRPHRGARVDAARHLHTSMTT
jgi:hypothetical protein